MKKPERPPLVNLESKDFDYFFKLFMDKDVNTFLAQLDNNKYPYWDKFKHYTPQKEYSSQELWAYNKSLRRKSNSTISLHDSSEFKFTLNITSRISQYLHEFDMNLGGNLDGGSIIPPEDKNRFLISSIMEEAIASSQLEGAVSTREEAKEMLKSERKPLNNSERMILNNYLTIRKITELRTKKITKELILEIHSTIAKGVMDSNTPAGEWRKSNKINVVDANGEIMYTPPSFEKIEELMDAFCDFANDNSNKNGFIHPIIKAIILHFLVGYIHPFFDGNGRTARAIFYWFMISRGYWLMEFLSISRIIIRSPIRYAKAYLYTI
jgi:fido (protein-threonine AMPylation protein)